MGVVSRQLISFILGDGMDKMIVLDREMRDGSARASGGCSCQAKHRRLPPRVMT